MALEQGMQCQPSCQRDIQNDETALSSETGFYWKFESDPETGRPFGCPGFDNDKWLTGTLADIYFCTGNFQKNVLSCYSKTTQDNETNDTPFESPIK